MEQSEKEYADYFMQPRILSNGLKVYPFKLKEYEKYKGLVEKYILLDITRLNNFRKQEFDKLKLERKIKKRERFKHLPYGTLYEYLTAILEQYRNTDLTVATILQSSEEERKKLYEQNPNLEEIVNSYTPSNMEEELCDLFSYCLKEIVTYNYDEKSFFVFEIKDGRNSLLTKITEDNFEEIRVCILEQNLIFEPIVPNTYKGAEVIRKAMQKLSERSEEVSFLAMVSAVSIYSGKSDAELMEYTYYRLLFDFEMVNRFNGNIFNAIFMSQGSKEAKITPLNKVFKAPNPYDSIFGGVNINL